jgi:hypothetical protein
MNGETREVLAGCGESLVDLLDAACEVRTIVTRDGVVSIRGSTLTDRCVVAFGTTGGAFTAGALRWPTPPVSVIEHPVPWIWASVVQFVAEENVGAAMLAVAYRLGVEGLVSLEWKMENARQRKLTPVLAVLAGVVDGRAGGAMGIIALPPTIDQQLAEVNRLISAAGAATS